MRYLLCLLLLASCGMPETARSAKQAEQAVDGVTQIVKEFPKDEAKAKEAFAKILKLLQSAKISLQPVLVYLGEGNDIKVETSVQEAVKQPDIFVAKATMQAGRAAVEVENRLTWEQYLDWELSDLESWISTLSLALTGSGAAGIAVIGVMRTIRRYKNTITDAVAFGKEAKAIDPKDTDALEALKERHAQRQKARGTKGLIDSSLQKVKDGSHA